MIDGLPLFWEIVLGIVTGGGILVGSIRFAIARYISEIDRKHKKYDEKFEAIDAQFEAIEPRLQRHFDRVDTRLTEIKSDIDATEQDFAKNVSKLHSRITTLLTDWPDRFVTRREFERSHERIESKLDRVLEGRK